MPSTGPVRPRFKARASILIACAIFGQDLAWNFFDAQVPPLLRNYVASAALIGLIMGMDNVFGIVLQPWIGHLSDRLRTRWGRRIPFIAIGMPVAGVMLALIPWASSALSLILCVFLFALVGNSYRSALESLLPDFVAVRNRSKGNAILKISIGLTTIVTSVIGLLVVDKDVRLAFAIPAVLMIAVAIIATFFLRETESPGYRLAVAEDSSYNEHRVRRSFFQELFEFLRRRDRGALLLLVGIILANGAWQAMRSLLTPYAQEVLGMSAGQAGSLTLPGGIVFILAAFPLAMLATRIGPLRVLQGGVVLLICAFGLAFIVRTPELTIAAVTIAGIGWSAVAVNAIVAFWSLIPSQASLGFATGLYFVAYGIGAAVGPAGVGVGIDAAGWGTMMGWAALLTIAAAIVFFTIRQSTDEPEQSLPDPVTQLSDRA